MTAGEFGNGGGDDDAELGEEATSELLDVKPRLGANKFLFCELKHSSTGRRFTAP